MHIIEQVAKLLGVEVYEEFKIKPTILAEKLGYKKIDKIFRFDSEFVHKGQHDGYAEWYAGNEKILYYLIIGLYDIVKIQEDTNVL